MTTSKTIRPTLLLLTLLTGLALTHAFAGSPRIPDALSSQPSAAFSLRRLSPADTAPAAPSKLSTSPGNGAILLQWSAGTNALNYLIEYKPSAGSAWTTYATVPSSQRGLTLTGLANGTSYDLRVSSSNAGGTSTPGSVASAIPAAAASFATAWNQTLSNGQSLSVGYGGTPALTTTQPFGNLMLTADNSGTIPLVETATGGDANYETMSSALANSLTNLAASAMPGYTDIVSMHGQDGQPYSALKKGTAPYARGIAEMNAAVNLATASGRSFSDNAVTIVHGETDEYYGVSASTYEGDLVQWQSDYQNDVQAVTGQTGTLPLFTDQMSSWQMLGHATPTTAIGQWMAGRDNPGTVNLVTPLYIMDYTDGVHLKNYSYRRLGEYFGKVMKQVFVDGKTWTPLSPRSVTRTGAVITAQFYVPVPPLVLDTAAVDVQANDGFEYYDASGSATISSVAVTGSDTVQITLSNVPATSVGSLRYAFTGTVNVSSGAHSAGAPKGNVRDSDVTPAYYQDGNVPAAMGIYLRNWLVTFDQPITVVTTVPDAPTGLGVAPAYDQATLSWTAPLNDGGSAITDYLVEYKPSASSTWATDAHVPSTATNAVVTNLAEGTSYDFRVSAVNAVGVGAPGNVVSAVTTYNPATYSPLQITVGNGTARTVASRSLGGYNYQLQRSYTLLSGSWVNVGPPQTGGGVLNFSDTPDPSQPRVFYRLSIQ